MKSIGIVGITAEGASECYKAIVRLSAERLVPNQHPEIILVNPSFDAVLAAQKQRDWQLVADIIIDAGEKCIAAGADLIIIPANSVHFAYDLLKPKLSVPVIHIVNVVADACKQKDFHKVAVLGVGLTMSDGLYDKALKERHIDQVKLTEDEVKQLDAIIYDELVRGIIDPASVEKIVALCEDLARKGCNALILACTELQMVLNKDNTPLPVLDSMELLAFQAVKEALI